MGPDSWRWMTPVQRTSNSPGGRRGCSEECPRLKEGLASMRLRTAFTSAADRYWATSPGRHSSASCATAGPEMAKTRRKKRARYRLLKGVFIEIIPAFVTDEGRPY